MNIHSKLTKGLVALALAAFCAAHSAFPARAADSLELGDATVGKPLTMKFKTLDGQDFDLSKHQGKVVLIDYWATWCPPCRAALPGVKATYEKLHPKGFEIVGISFDKSKGDLKSFLAKEKMTWPQYFDGLFWDNKIGKKYGIEAIPTTWLVDKKGNLREKDAGENLAQKVEKLLAE